jgi:hypothetical protein
MSQASEQMKPTIEKVDFSSVVIIDLILEFSGLCTGWSSCRV